RHTRCLSDWSSDVCSSDLALKFRCCGAALVREQVSLPTQIYWIERCNDNLGRPAKFVRTGDLQVIQTAARIAVIEFHRSPNGGRSEERRVGKRHGRGGAGG